VSYEVSGVSDAKILLFSEKNKRALLFVGDVHIGTRGKKQYGAA
jgi:hypothetical protein